MTRLYRDPILSFRYLFVHLVSHNDFASTSSSIEVHIDIHV